MNDPSFRAELLIRRTYNRPKEDGTFETWNETIDRVLSHQKWLWERAQGASLNGDQVLELLELKDLLLERKVSLSGRTLWLGGTDTAKKYEASQFNCAFLNVETVTDVVDAYWLLLQGCGVGFTPITGTLSGFSKKIKVEHQQPTWPQTGGPDENTEITTDTVHIIRIGDSAQAWAKAVGKILAYKGTQRLVIDYGRIRKAGIRLKGYGWMSQGYLPLQRCIDKICEIMNNRSGKLLTKIDILDILNHIGTTLSSRRSAEICLMEYNDPEVNEFINAKKSVHLPSKKHRVQSNNSVIFRSKPTRMELRGLFQVMLDNGGSEPGFINGETALKRAPWFKGVNPCAEILLGNKSFCNLVEINVSAFDIEDGDYQEIGAATRLVSRANYRQTCVDLRDGVLSDSWHELNSYLRLCGVGLTGIVQSTIKTDLYEYLRRTASFASVDMALALNLPLPKAITTVKPSGTLSKIMDTTEGVHKPLGKYIFNNINFGKDDPLVQQLRDADYNVFDNPFDDMNVIVTIPVVYDDVEFTMIEGVEVNVETAGEQLDRYFELMDSYVDHNCSITISYDPSEVEMIVDKLLDNWDQFVGVSFILRNDPTKTAEDLGYLYLPQEVVPKWKYDNYVATLQPVTLSNKVHGNELEPESDCEGGACPVR